MVLEVRRSLRERATLFIATWVFASLGVFVLLLRYFPKSGTTGGAAAEGLAFCSVIVGLVGAFALDAVVGASIHAFRIARLGTPSERKVLLEKTGRDGDSAGIALVAIEHASLPDAADIIGRFPTEKKQQTTLEELVQLRYRLATVSLEARPKLLDEILDWRPSTFGAHALELERYAVFVVASHHDAGPLADRTQAIARRLLANRDEQIRGYGTWLALELEELPNGATASADFSVGAALAKHHGRADLAGLLDARAAKLAAGTGTTAYRD